MEHTLLVIVALVVALLVLHHEADAAAAEEGGKVNNSSSSIHGHGLLAVDVSHSQMMHLVQAHHERRFSYCLRMLSPVPGAQRHGILRLDGEVPSTSGMPPAQILYNANHAADYGPSYFVDLVGVSVAGTMLPGVNADTFRRNDSTGTGGTVLDVGAPALMMVPAAYAALEHAVYEHLRPLGLPRVARTGFTFCVRGATQQVWRRLPLVKLHFRHGAELLLHPNNLFGANGQDACLLVLPGPRTIIGAWPQGNTRVTFDLDANAVFLRMENCRRDTAGTTF